MIRDITLASFGLIWKIEERPLLDILSYKMNNNPLTVDSLEQSDTYETVVENIEYIYADGPIAGETTDDTTRSDLTVFIRELDLPVKPNSKLIFKIDGRLYRLAEKDVNPIFGLYEFNLDRAD